MTQPRYVSREGLETLKSELEQLRMVRRQDVANRIQQSRESGGVESNAVIIEEGSGRWDTVEVEDTISVKSQDGRSQIQHGRLH